LGDTYFDDPVAGYDHMAAHFAELSRGRDAYLRSVEQLILARIPHGSRSLLDIGAGDGVRARRIASAAGIPRLVLLEPSAAMAALAGGPAELWPIRAEALKPEAITERFDVVTCLWNVLGHIRPGSERQRTLTGIAQLLTPHGLFFLDVNHRYNARSHGVVATAARWIHDRLLPSDTNGDARAKWSSGSEIVSTFGHVFTDREVVRLAHAARLKPLERFVVDYDTGQRRRFAFSGNLLYVFRRSSRIDSSSAPHTS
jgi:SAM-dependent methyltransferase